MDGNFEVQVRQRAYELWLTDGMVAGRDQDHWLAAERELARQHQQAAADVQAARMPAKARKAKSKARGKG